MVATPGSSGGRGRTRADVGALLVAAAVGATSLLASVVSQPTPAGWWVVLDVVVGAGAVFLLRWRRAHPVVVASVVIAASVVASAALGAVLVALVAVATTRRWRTVAGVGLLLGALTFGETVVRHGWDLGYLRADLVLGGTIWAACTAAGAYLGSRNDLVRALTERAEAAERAAAAEQEQTRVAERTRIAREMHDVLAHRISLVAMHAGVLAFRADLPGDERTRSAEVVRDNANLALLELRQVLGVLRDPRRAGDDLAASFAEPQSSLAALDELGTQARARGDDVTVDIDDASRARLERIPVATSRHVHRIVQEALTNARKHAPGARTRVEVRVGDAGVRLTVENGPPVPGSAAPPPGSRFGLIGVDERIRQLGGTWSHGPDAVGGYRLHAELPLTQEERS